jgi:hypothetical protein
MTYIGRKINSGHLLVLVLGLELFGAEDGGIQLGICLDFRIFLAEDISSVHKELDARG